MVKLTYNYRDSIPDEPPYVTGRGVYD